MLLHRNKEFLIGLLICFAQEAVTAFSRLEPEQYSTGWVLCCVGRAYYEMVDYQQAASVFEWARTTDPTRLQVWT